MRIKQCVIAISMLIISALICVGCAEIQFFRAIDANNVIIDKLVIELDESKLNKKGLDLKTIIDTIDDDMDLFRIYVDNWKNQFDNYKTIKEVIKDGIFVEVTPTDNKISIAIQFSGIELFGLFYGYAEIEDVEYVSAIKDVGPFISSMVADEYTNENLGLFLMKYSILKSGSIAGQIENFEFHGTKYYDKYMSLTNNKFSLEDIDLSQYFIYPDDRLHSNADYSYVEGGLTWMQWDLDNKSQDFEMEIYKIGARVPWWYALALVISAVFVLVFTIIVFVRAKKNPREKITRWDVEKDGK